MDEHLTVAEAATHLGYSERYVRKLIERGELRALTAGRGRRLLIPVTEVETFFRPHWTVRAEAAAAQAGGEA